MRPWPPAAAPQVRSSASDLIRCLLAGDPSQRPGLDAVLAHPFLALPSLAADAARTRLLRWTGRARGDEAEAGVEAEQSREGGAEGAEGGGSPQKRPRLSSEGEALAGDERSHVDSALSLLLLNTDLRRARYRFFISHSQADAAGTAKSIFNLFDRIGVACWYDARHFPPDG